MDKMVANINGKLIDFDVAMIFMDDAICEELHAKMAGHCTQQDFFNAYEKAHYKAYGEVWELSKSNPVY